MKPLEKTMMPYIFMLAALLGTNVGAQDFETDNSDLDLGGDESVYNSEEIDVDGAFSYREQMEQRRKRNRQQREERRELNRLKREENLARIQDRHADMIEREQAKNEHRLKNKVGKLRISNEKQLLKKLFNKESEMSDSLTTSQMAPVTVMPAAPVVMAPQPEEEAPESHSFVDMGVNFNSSHFDGKDVDMSSDSGFSLTLSRQMANNFSMGISGGITSMSILVKDHAPTTSALGNVDTDYQRLHVELTGKTYFATTERFRPYFQVGAGFNRVSLSLDEEQLNKHKKHYRSSPYYNRRNDDRRRREDNENTEKLSKYILSGSAQLGVAFVFNQNLGLDVSAGYRHNFTTPFKNIELDHRRNRHYDRMDRDREKEVLTNLGRKLEKSSEVSLNAGFVIRF